MNCPYIYGLNTEAVNVFFVFNILRFFPSVGVFSLAVFTMANSSTATSSLRVSPLTATAATVVFFFFSLLSSQSFAHENTERER